MLIILPISVLLLITSLLLLPNFGRRQTAPEPEPVCLLRNNQQMLDFITASAGTYFPNSTITLNDTWSPDSLVQVKTLRIEYGSISIYLCRDRAAREKLNHYFYRRESTKFRSEPVVFTTYGELVELEYFGSAPDIILFMQSVVIDSREGMKKFARWRQWLIGRHIPIEISDSEFTLHNRSLTGLVRAPYQTLSMRIGGHPVELICLPDSGKARQTAQEFTKMREVMDVAPGVPLYEMYGPYGQFLVLLQYGENFKKIEPLIRDFWGPAAAKAETTLPES